MNLRWLLPLACLLCFAFWAWTASPPVEAESTAIEAIEANEAIEVIELETTADAWIDEAAPSDNHGTAVNLFTSRNASNEERLTLLAFDDTPLPDNIVVISATLELFNIINQPQSVTSGNDMYVEAVVTSWNEGNVTWNNRPASAYANDPASTWVPYGWTSFDVSNIVQGWVDGSINNHGLLITVIPNETGTNFFFSRESGTVPRLKIAYEPAPPTCETITAVVINGPTEAQKDVAYTYDATLSPVNATGPLSYTWTSPGQPTQTTPTAVFTWDTTGPKTINLTVENCGGPNSNSRTTTIVDPAPNCPHPLTSLHINGPTTGLTTQDILLEAVVGPDEATTPITYHWQPLYQSNSETTSDLLADERTYSFGSGPNEVTVTAENCGGTFTRRHALHIDLPSFQPDLRITSLWYDAANQRLGYILRNDGPTAVSANHETDIFINDTLLTTQPLSENLPAQAIRAYYVNHTWACAEANASLTLRADARGDISEGNEDNNEYHATWPCDLVRPEITLGPAVTNITETTARVRWTTSEPTTGRVQYGQTSYAPYEIDLTTPTTQNNIVLNDLQPGRTYRVRVFSNGNAGNEINSEWLYFETAPPGTDPPQITEVTVVETPGTPYEMFTIQATVSDATYVDRVEFYLDGVLIGTQVGTFENTFFQLLAPHTLGYSRDAFYDQLGRDLEVKAYSIGGASSDYQINHTFDNPGQPIRILIFAPGDNDTVIFDGNIAPEGTTRDVVVWASQYDWACTTDGQDYAYIAGLACEDAFPRAPEELALYLSGSEQERRTLSQNDFVNQFELDLSGRGPGERTVAVRAYVGNQFESEAVKLNLERGEPQLRFTRQVERDGNLFTIALTVHNDGDGTAELDNIQDMLQGFVAINKDTRPGDPVPTADALAEGYYQVTFDPPASAYWLNSSTPSVQIDFLGSEIPPNDSFTITYEAIPVIYPFFSDNFYRIGLDEVGNSSTVQYEYAGSGGLVESNFSAPGHSLNEFVLGQVPLSSSLALAFRSSDYLLVTNLYRLQSAATSADQIPGLLTDMARLAKETDGIIALPRNLATAGEIDDLLEKEGFWYENMSADFREALSGYVLFVGEEEIIPVQSGGWGVDYSDLRYASTGGAARPELVLGRIIGDDVGNMRKPIQAAAAFHRSGAFFDSSEALIWSGRDDGEGTFWGNVKGMDSRLSDRGTAVTRFRSKNYDSHQELLPLLQQNSSGKDWIIYRGHGYRYGFADVVSYTIRTDTVSTLNLTTRPVVLALACTTGDFRQNDNDDYGIAEAFLANGAAVFIGSTEVSSRARNSSASRALFNRWHDGRTVGYILSDVMRDRWGNSSWWWSDSATWERWAYDYHTFGDPKYGQGVAPPKDVPPTTAVVSDLADTTLNINLPDLEIIDLENGWHEVVLPEGDQLALRDEYGVPIQTIVQHIPAGQRVQEVSLTNQSGLELHKGLRLRTNYFQLDAPFFDQGAFIGPERPTSDPYDGWYPDVTQPYQWRVLENPDGSSDLRLTIYPFQYNPATTDGRFYKTWQFEVQTVNSNVAIDKLTVPHTAVSGETVPVQVALSHSGPAQDVFVSAEVLSIEGEPLAGMPLQTVRGLDDTAVVVNLPWDTSDLPARAYQVRVSVSDSQGQVLAEASDVVTVGQTELGVTNLTATPNGQVNYTVVNTGTVTVGGTAVVHVQNEQMETVAMIRQAVAPLESGANRALGAQWATGGVPNGDYNVSVFVVYDGTASDITATNLTLGERKLYLPFIAQP